MAYENSRSARTGRGGQGRPGGRRDDRRSFEPERNQERKHPFVSDRWGEEEESPRRAPRRFEDSTERAERGRGRFARQDGSRFEERGARPRPPRRYDDENSERPERGRGRGFGRQDDRHRDDRRFEERGAVRRAPRRFENDEREERGRGRFDRQDDRRYEERGARRSPRRFEENEREERGRGRFARQDDRRYEERGERRGGYRRPAPRHDRGFEERESYRPRRRQERGDQARHAENISKKEAGYIRLNRYIANAGICSRREADTMIESGAVMVNGQVCTVLGTLVGPNDKVQMGEQTLSAEKKVYLLLNKPKGYITTADDPEERKTVMELVRDACKERIYPVGRLDRNTTGVLLFTNDGDIAKNLTHPSHGARKIYQVTLSEPLNKADFTAISKGVTLEDGFTEVDEISYIAEDNKREIGIQLHSGKNRIVRRIFEHFGYEVVKLDRVLFAELTKKELRRGAWRFLSEQEINFLRMNAGKKAVSKKAAPKSAQMEMFTAEQLEEAEALAQADEAPLKKRRSTRKKAE